MFATNSISDGGAEHLASVIKLAPSSLTYLDLECNKIGDPGGLALGDALKTNVDLRHLSLANNRIGVEGATVMAEALKRNASLTTLDFRYNLLFDAGASVLGPALATHKALTHVNLGTRVLHVTHTCFV